MRIRGAKTEMEEAGLETEGMVESTAKLRQEILALSGVDIMLNANEFKSTYQILEELANKWQDLTDIQQASVTELIAGKRQGNVISSLMNNFDIAEQALETSLNSAGSAMAEHEKWMQSLEARLLKLKATWQSLSQSFMSSKFLKVILDVVIEFVNIIDILIDKLGVLPTILIGSGIFKFTKTLIGVGGIQSLGDILAVLAEAFPTVTGVASTFFKTLTTGGVALASTKAAFSGLWAVVAAHPIMATVAAVGLGIAAYNKFAESAEELAERVDETTSKFKEQQTELVRKQSSFESQAERYVELSKGINDVGENISLTADEYAEYQNIVNSIADQVPSLIVGFNSQGDAILDCAGDVGVLTQAYKNLILQANKKVLDSGEDYFEDFHNKMLDTNYNLDGLTSTGYEALTDILKSNNIDEAVDKYLETNDVAITKIKNALKNAGLEQLDGETGVDFIRRALTEEMSTVNSIISDFENELAENSESIQALTQAYFSTAFLTDYSDMSNEMQNIINQIVSGFDAIFYEEKFGKDYEAYKDYFESMLETFDNLDISKSSTLEAAFNLQTKFNGGEISYGKYIDSIQNVESLINDLGLEKEVETQLKLNLGLIEDDGKWVVEEYENLLSRLTSKEYEIQLDTKSAESFIKGLGSGEELSVAIDFIESGNEDFNNVLQNYKNILNEAEEASVDFSKTVYGNIDTNARHVLEWTGENLEKYKDELMSWEADDASWDNIKKDFEGTVSTVMGAWDTFKIGEKEVNFTFSTALNTDDGLVPLSRDSVNNYINKLIEKATEDGNWSNDELLKLDAEGLEVDGQKIKGILADIGDTAEATSIQMHFVGKDGALALAKSEMMALVEEEAKVLDAMSFNMSIDIETESLEALNTAISESVSSMGLSSESLKTLQSRYEKLDSFDPYKLFEKSAQGVHLNRDELNKLEKELAKSKIEEIDEALDTVTEAYKDVTEEIRICTDEKERELLVAEQLSYADKIKELSELKTQYKGLTSAYNNWVNAQESGEEGDIYDDVITKLESAAELRKKGLVGTNEFAAAVEFMSGKDTSSMTVDEIVAAYDKALHKMNRYFTESSDGAKNLLNDLNGINEEWVAFENGEWKLNIPIEEAAKELGISVDALEAILGKGSDYGLTINYDSVYEASKSLEELYTEAESANNKLRELGKTDLTFSFESDDADDLTSQIEKAQKLLDEFRNEDGTINLNVEGAEEAKLVLATLMRQKQEVAKPAFMNVSAVTVGDEKLGKAIELIQKLQTYKDTYDIEVAIDADTSETETKIQEVIGQINTLKTENPEVFASLNLDKSEFNTALETLIANINAGVQLDPNALTTVQTELNEINAKVLADIGIGDTSDIDKYTSTEQKANGTVDWGNNTLLVDAYKDELHIADGTVNWGNNTTNVKTSFTATGTINWTDIGFSGTGTPSNGTATPIGAYASFANGTAFVDGKYGKAFKRGDWGVKNSGIALGGELGQELVVRDGKFFTIGDNGAEFFKYKKNDIIFNAGQTKELFEKGKIVNGKTRGRALVNGTTFADGRAFGDNSASGGGKLYGSSGGSSGSSSNSVTGESYKKSSSSNTSDKFEEVLDWVEVIIDRVERAIDKYERQANNIYKSWSSRNKALQNQISEVSNEISLQQKAYNKYMEAANGVGLSSSWAEKARNGEIDIDTITDEVLADKIKSYTEWYEKALDCQDAIEELKQKESELYAQRIENVTAQYEGVLGVIEHEKNMIEQYISQSEANAQLISGEYYSALIKNENETIAQLQNQKNEMISELNTAMNSGAIDKYSEGWYEIVNSIDEVTLSIAESQTQIKEWQQTIQQLSWETFDLLHDKISSITEETEFMIELLSSDKLYDDNGKLTDEGSATMGLHGQNYNTYMYQADLVAKELERLKGELAKDPYDTELEERYREMIALQQEYILNAQDEKEAIRDLVSEGIEIELDALQELIDKKNEELESERNLYEYQKKVLEQTKEVSSLEKQIAAYSGDDSEEAKAKIQELKVSLEEAKTNLEETEYDKYISDQGAMLDNLYLAYEEILNMRLDNLDALVEQVIGQINMDATSISTTLSEKADSVGYSLSDSMNTIWDTNSTKINNVITTYGEKFTSSQTTTNNALSTINSNLQKMITQLNFIAKTNTKSASASSVASPKQSSTNTSTNTTTNNTTTTSNTTTKSVKVGGMVNASGAQIYDHVGDTSGERQLYRNDPKYKVLKVDGSWIQVRWHKLTSGVTGWFKKSDVKAYKTGKKNILDSEVAWTQENGTEFIVRPSDGAILTPLAKGDSVLNAEASSNIWKLATTPAEFIKDNLNLGGASIPNNSNVNNNITQNVNANLNFPNVKSYEEMLISLSRDPKFQKLIDAMTTDQYLGKSSLAKGKIIK